MVNLVDTERLLKTIIAQFCDQNFKFTLNLKILGSIHVVVDNTEVLTCLLDEKYFKQPNGQVVTSNARSKQPSESSSTQLNLVTTLNQLGGGSQAPASLSSKSTSSSSSSTCSSSSYTSESTSSSKHNKRKRFIPRGLLSETTGVTTNGGEAVTAISADEDEDDDDEVVAKTEAETETATPTKRGKMIEESDEQAAATTLSLISASKMLMAPHLLGGYHHHNQFMQQPTQNVYQVQQQAGSVSSAANANLGVQQQSGIMKPKSKYIR